MKVIGDLKKPLLGFKHWENDNTKSIVIDNDYIWFIYDDNTHERYPLALIETLMIGDKNE